MSTSKYYGIIDIVTANVVKGWIVDNESDQPVIAELYVNSKKVAEQLADIPRPGLVKNQNHPTGKAGFHFTEATIGNKDKVSIAVKGKKVELTNSPWKYIKSNNRILIVGLAKSGTSILAYRIHNGLKGSKLNFEPGGGKGLVDYTMHREMCMNEKVVTKSLFPYHSRINWDQLNSIYDK